MSEDENLGVDQVSICAFSTNPTSRVVEYFLESHPQGQGFTFCSRRILDEGKSWHSFVEEWLDIIGISLGLRGVELGGILKVGRWFVPETKRMASHVVCSLNVPSELREQFTQKLDGLWFSASEIMNIHTTSKKIQSVEIVDIILKLELQDIRGEAMFMELHPNEAFIGLLDNQKTGIDKLIQSANFGVLEQEQLYKEFLRYSLPFLVMGPGQFIHLMSQLGWEKNEDKDLSHLFRTFDMGNRGGLTFHDLLCGLAVIEPTTQHGGAPAEVRCRYIFRFFDKNNDGRLDFKEFKKLVEAILTSKGLKSKEEEVNKEVEKAALVFGDKISETLGQTEFLSAVGQLKFRGTSNLLRCPKSILGFLKKQKGDDKQTPSSSPTEIVNTTSQSLLNDNGILMETDVHADLQSYDVATHCVRVKRSGTILDIHSLWDIEHSGLSPSTPSNLTLTAPVNRIKSLENFNQSSQPNELLNGLRYFEREIIRGQDPSGQLPPKPNFDWGLVDKSSLAKCIISISQQATAIFSKESRLLQLSSPVYILGDIHGNFPDLLCFEKALWRLGPSLTPSSFLFLGDYVDRGLYSVEVISYLFSHKISAPNKVFLLRGNHEIREVQKMFTFYTECLSKFGDKIGQDVWEAVNTAFDSMPLAAVIDKKVFCAHGGIPPPWIGHGMLAVINKIPSPLPKPEEQSNLAWELMWSDPLHCEEENDKEPSEPQTQTQNGFSDNKRRGTAHVFSALALDAFLKRNHLSHVVRAHEVQQAGFKVQLDGKLLSVFSSSKYCGGSNEAACILADKYKLRTIRIDTSLSNTYLPQVNN